MKNLLFWLLSLLVVNNVMGQGTLRGTVVDDANEPAMYANVLVVETSTGVTTDLDGQYSISLASGTYTVEYSYVGLKKTTLKDVIIKDGEINIKDIQLQADAVETPEIVVVGTAGRKTVGAMNTIKQNSAGMVDGVTAQTFKIAGISDASGALKKVTGVSVQGGKYIFVRGLGDRYTKTILNSMDVPGLDPDRNAIQMDIFPTNLIDNILVMKTFSPNLPADFTGGVINIETKEFPEQKTFRISTSIGYNPAMNLNPNYLTYKGSNTDFLGFDNSVRDLPISKGVSIPTTAQNNNFLTTLTGLFNPTLATQQQMSPLNGSLSVSGGNQYEVDNIKIGINAALNYRNRTTYFEGAEFNQYIKADDPAINTMDVNKEQIGNIGKNNVLLSGLIGAAIKTKGHKISLSALHLQNGESTAGDFVQNTYISTNTRLVRDNLEYTQRSLSNALLKGEHTFQEGKHKLEWKVSPTFSTLKDKDIRLTTFRDENGVLEVQFSEGAVPTRIFRDLEEFNLGSKFDFTTKLDEAGDSKLRIGGSYVTKQRDYFILNYQFNVRNQENVNINGNPDLLLAPKNLWNIDSDAGTYVIGNFEPSNEFTADQNVLGAYAMNDWRVNDKIRIIWGVRTENFEHLYTGVDQGGERLEDAKIIDTWKVFPSANVVYSIVKDMNIRVAYAKTVARPSFKEVSNAQIYDALSDRTFIGNLDLIETDITNFDLRWEFFQDKGQLFSVSTFYKAFKNPIELVAFKPQTPNDFQPKNNGDASVLGLELEFRKRLDFISSNLSKFELGSNITLVRSELEMDDEEFESRQANARVGETIDRTRQMQGQSPYIINASLNYLGGFESGWEGNISYNVQGPSLFIVGIGANPDVFQQPFHSLNMKVSKGFGDNNKYRASLRVTNILNDDLLKQYESFMADSQIFERFLPNRTFTAGFSYRIF